MHYFGAVTKRGTDTFGPGGERACLGRWKRDAWPGTRGHGSRERGTWESGTWRHDIGEGGGGHGDVINKLNQFLLRSICKIQFLVVSRKVLYRRLPLSCSLTLKRSKPSRQMMRYLFIPKYYSLLFFKIVICCLNYWAQ